jgi:hypothetical protein
MTLDRMITINEDAVWARVDSEIVAVNMGDGRYTGLRGAATIIWEGLVEGATREELVRRVLDTYDVPAERAARDIDATLADLTERRLIRETDAG